MSASRSTVSFTEKNWEKLSQVKNKSLLVNTALKFFFDAEDVVTKTEKEFILSELKHYKKSGESYKLKDVINELK